LAFGTLTAPEPRFAIDVSLAMIGQRRPLVFNCPDGNLTMISHMFADAELAWKSRDIPFEVDCPCGKRHTYRLGEGCWWLQKTPTQASR